MSGDTAAIEAPVTIGIVAALAAEARPLGRAASRGGDLAALPDGSRLAVSGMGFDAAARSARRLLDAGCGALVSWGLAGGLDPALAAGTVVIPEMILLEDASADVRTVRDGAPGSSAGSAGPERIQRAAAVSPVDSAWCRVDSAWRAQVVSRLAGSSSGAHLTVVGGALLTAPRAYVSAVEKANALRRTGAIAVDMESYAVAEVAASRGLPFLCVRAIVDTALDDVPDVLADAADARGRIAIGSVLAGVISHPATLRSLLRLSRKYRLARAALRRIAQTGVTGENGMAGARGVTAP